MSEKPEARNQKVEAGTEQGKQEPNAGNINVEFKETGRMTKKTGIGDRV